MTDHRPTAVQGFATAFDSQSGGTGSREAAINSARCFELAISLIREEWLRTSNPGESAHDWMERTGRRRGYFRGAS